MSSTSGFLSDPDVVDWFSPQRTLALEAALLAATPTLTVSGLLRQVAEGWIRQQLALDAPWTPPERRAFAEERVAAYEAKRNPAKFGHDSASLLDHLSTGEGCRRWAQAQWHGRLQSVYLARKAELDQASCLMLRVSDPHLAQELYFRVSSGESSFQALASQFSEGPERQSGGAFPKQPVARLPLGLPAVLQDLKPGELTSPRPLGDGWALVQLQELEPARFEDEAVQEQLLSDQLGSWLSEAVNHAIAHLVSVKQVAPASLAHPHA